MNKAEKETLLHRTAPSRQKQAQEYLQGRSPGAMQRYAPDAPGEVKTPPYDAKDKRAAMARPRAGHARPLRGLFPAT